MIELLIIAVVFFLGVLIRLLGDYLAIKKQGNRDLRTTSP